MVNEKRRESQGKICRFVGYNGSGCGQVKRGLDEIGEKLCFLKDEQNGIFILYDEGSDIHYFFV